MKRKKASFRKPNCGFKSRLKIRNKGFSRSKFEYLEGIVQESVLLHTEIGALKAVIHIFAEIKLADKADKRKMIEFDKRARITNRETTVKL